MGGVREQLVDLIFRKKSPHGHERVDETDGFMYGGEIQEREDWEVVF